jgi:hypothetical protein
MIVARAELDGDPFLEEGGQLLIDHRLAGLKVLLG